MMKTNYYSVYEKKSEFRPSTLISFTDKEKAEKHRDLLNDAGGNYTVIPSEITLFIKLNEKCAYSQP